MSWQIQPNGRRYYTKSRRVRGRIVRQYWGSGPVAEAIARLDELDREERERNAEAERQSRETLKTLDREVGAFYASVEIVTRAALEDSGYHQHDRGEWRKQRAF